MFNKYIEEVAIKDYTYNFEIKDLITQFIAAFDDVVIKRYDSNRVAKENIEVRYVLAPKQRVMYDIVNKAQNLTLPVVAVDIASISRANDRVFNKIDNFYTPYTRNKTSNVKMPIPIDITINMSILARYMQDIDQILSNFIPYSNPYIILSWKEPSQIEGQVVEIRSEVLWNGNISFNNPTDTTYNDKFRIVCDTSFTIKGWLFKNKNELSTPIYFIDVNTYAMGRTDILTYESLTGLDLKSVEDSYTLSALPTITNIFYYTTGSLLPINFAEISETGYKFWEFDVSVNNTINNFNVITNPVNDVMINWVNNLPPGRFPSTLLPSGSSTSFTYTSSALSAIPPVSYKLENVTLSKSPPFINSFLIYGNNYNYTDLVLLSTNNLNITNNLTLTTIESKYTGTATGFILPISSYTIVSDEIISVNIPYLSLSGSVDIIINNPSGWVTSHSLSGFTFEVP